MLARETTTSALRYRLALHPWGVLFACPMTCPESSEMVILRVDMARGKGRARPEGSGVHRRRRR
jgi:hypothetical protein